MPGGLRRQRLNNATFEVELAKGISLTEDLVDDVPPYAILSYIWGADSDEVTFADVQQSRGRGKAGSAKIWSKKRRDSLSSVVCNCDRKL